jgi:PAS domain S-box-containing protein
MSDKPYQKAAIPWLMVSLFLVLTIIVIVMGFLYGERYRKTILNEKEKQIEETARQKVVQIIDWRSIKTDNGHFVQENSFICNEIREFLSNPDNQKYRESLNTFFESLISHFDAKSIILIGRDGITRLSLPASDTIMIRNPEAANRGILKNPKHLFDNAVANCPADRSYIRMAIPFVDSTGTEKSVIGVLVINLNPNTTLFPEIQKWPEVSNSAEIIIVENYGDSLDYLTKLRNDTPRLKKQKDSAGGLLVPESFLDSSDEGVVDGFDYRGVRVVAAIRHVPNSKWFVVSKIDKDELMLSIRDNTMRIALFTTLLIFVLLSLLGTMMWRQQMNHYRRLYKAETDKQALIKHFDYILKFANDLIFLVNKDLSIIEANDRVLEFYGYTRDEILRMKVSDFRSPANVSSIREQYSNLIEKKSATFETIHRRKDGSEFPIELSARLMEIEGEVYFQTIGRDITERRYQEEKLNNLLMRFNLALSAANMGVWDWDFVNNNLIWDDKLTELYGREKNTVNYSVDEWINSVHPDDVENARAEVRIALKELTDYNSEYRIILPDGTIKYIKSFGRVMRDSHGNTLRMTGVAFDITKQKLALDLLKEREFWLTESQRVGQLGSYSLDIQTNTWSTSEVLNDILGLKNDAKKSIQTWQDIIHPDFKEEMQLYIDNEILIKGKLFNKEFKIIKPDTGEERWVMSRGEISWDINKNPVTMIGTIQDITERKYAEEELRQSNNKINTIINNLKGVIFRSSNDKDWTMKYISDGIFDLAGYEPNDFIENKVRSFNSIIYSGDRHRVWNDIQEGLKNDSAYTTEYRIITSSGAIRWVWERGRGYYDGQIIKTIEGFITDITDRKHVEEELIRAKEKAEESDRLKTAFLHNISHEIRTPMNAIVGFTTLLDTPDINDDTKRQYMDIVFQSSDQLLSIITDIVDISNIEVGHVKLSIGIININILIKNLFDQFNLRARQQGLDLSYLLAFEDDSSLVMTDGTKLIQVLTNLINNAIKFTKAGSVEFGYNLRGSDVEFFVKDTGIGIEESKFQKVFERFYQIENPNSKQYSGTGLGLSISKAYVELMGGRIWLTSKPGKGTIFYFTIPYDSPEKRKPTIKPNPEKKNVETMGKTILVAEDDRINFLLIREILSKTGINIIWAANGEEAVEFCRKNKDIDLILMDIKMPLMDGYEAIKIIKEFKPDLPIIALTAYASSSDRDRALKEGCVDHIPKPIDRTQFFSILQKYL